MRYLEKRFLISGIYLLFMASAAFATNRYVSVDGTNDSAGGFTNWVGAATNIQSAANAATALDTVYVSNGVYSLSAPVTSAVSLSIIGTGGVVTVDGNNLFPCFVFALNKTNNLSNITITKGYNSSTNSGNGGGVWLANGTILDCIFSNNVATNNGGGLYFYNGGNGVIQGCTFYGNSSILGNGGGLYLYTVKTVVVDNCSFRSNAMYRGAGGGSDGGGAIKVDAGTRILITNSVFEFNVCTGVSVSAGAVYMASGTYITHCTFTSNSTYSYSYGGAIRMNGGTLSNCFISNNVSLGPGSLAGGVYQIGGEVKNCVISDNQSGSYGGGMVLQVSWKVENCIIERNSSTNSYGGGIVILTGNTNSYLRNCLIRNNVARANGGGGIRIASFQGVISCCTIVSNNANGTANGGGLDNESTTTGAVENCIIFYNNSGLANVSNYYLITNSISFTNCLVSPAPTGWQTNIFVNVQTNSPQFLDWLSGNYRLAQGSPCINSGVNRDWMTGALDLDGHRRIDKFSGVVDLGCYEYIPNGTMFVIP